MAEVVHINDMIAVAGGPKCSGHPHGVTPSISEAVTVEKYR